MGRLEGRVAFVTGAGRGIGAATALRMAEEGARVALADVDTEGCQQVAAELSRLGSEGLVLHCNVADSAMVQDAVDRAAGYFGQLDILVNNAGVLRDNLLYSKGWPARFDTYTRHRTWAIRYYRQRYRPWFYRYRNDTLHRTSPGTRPRRRHSRGL